MKTSNHNTAPPAIEEAPTLLVVVVDDHPVHDRQKKTPTFFGKWCLLLLLEVLQEGTTSCWITLQERTASCWITLQERAASCWIKLQERTASWWITLQERTASCWITQERTALWWITLQERTASCWITLQERTASCWITLQERTASCCITWQKWCATTIAGGNDVMKNVHWAFTVFKRSDCTVVQLSTMSYVAALLFDDHVHEHSPIKVLFAWLICSMCCEISLIRHKVIIRQCVRDKSSVHAAAFILSCCEAAFCAFLHIWCEWNSKHFASICLANSCLSATYHLFEMVKPMMDFDPRSFFLSTSSVLDNTSELESGDGALDHASLPLEQPPNESQTDEAPHSPRGVMSIASILSWFQ
jgi:hypothetical protein